MSKVPSYMLSYYPQVPNFTPFCSTIARFPDNRGFNFFIGYNGAYAIFEKSGIQILKNPQGSFCEDHWEDNSGQVSQRLPGFVGGVEFRHFRSHWVPCSKTNKKFR